jgi:hypothetical protein
MTGRGSLTILCIAAVLAHAPAAQAGWSEPTTVARVLNAEAAVATSAGQGAAVAWRGDQPRVVNVRRIGPRGALGATTAFSGPLSGVDPGPQVAVSATGAIVTIWSVSEFDSETGETTSTLFARRMRPGGKLGPVRTIARMPNPGNAAALGKELAVDAAGNATIAWVHSFDFRGSERGTYPTRRSVRVRHLSPDGTLGPTVIVTRGNVSDSVPALAVAPSGRGVLAWVHRGADQRYGVRARLIARDRRLGRLEEVSLPQQYWSGNAPDVAVDRNGRATIAWSAPTSGVGSRVFARQLTQAGLAPLHALTPGGSTSLPVVAFDGRGTATVAWAAYPEIPPGGSNDQRRIEARQIRSGGGLGPLRVLAPEGPGYEAPVLAADGLGNTTVVWVGPGIRARRLSRRGQVGPVRTLTTEGEVTLSPVVAADADGVVTAAWPSRLRGNFSIRAARFVP